ncbi:uncharacterized protein LOC115552718 [Gadus morhua]|uniref:uncharacterized protein LOC115552718 n=1 Tax=Gadus morhua TaxID=8049 RepID=UPI0011B6D807|nr:uncharacterized protein LOC115552718 [Gadus morhua]
MTSGRGHLGAQPDPGPSLRTSNSEVKAAVDFTPASAPPWRVVVSGSSLRAVISQLLTQVSPGSHPPVWWFTIFQEVHRLLRSSFPWVRVRVDRQQANCLLQPIAHHQLAKYIMARLEKQLIPWNGLEKALLTTPHIFQHYAVYLVATGIAGLVPDQLAPSQKDLLRTECTLKSLPPGSMLTVSSDLVDDLMVKLVLRLQPLNGEGYRPLNQQTLLTTTLKMSCFILARLRNMPGITVDTSLPCPCWDIRRLAMLVHCGLTKSLGSSLQVGLVADECMVEEHWLRASSLLSLLKGHNVLVSILWEVVEALLARYHSDRPEESSIPTQVPRVMQEEQEMEEELLSQRLPEQLREQLYGTFGTWVQHGKLFGRALPPMSTAEQDLRGGDVAVLSNTLADDPVALNPSLDAPQKEQPDSHSRCDPSVMENSSCGPVTGDPLPPAAQPENGESNSVSTTDPVVIQRSTVGFIVAQLFRGRDEMSSPSHIDRYRAFQNLVVREVHLLLQEEATMNQDNPGFERTLERLKDPVQEEKLGLQLRWVLEDRLKEALPGVCLSRDGLMKDPPNTLLACSLIATVVLDHLKTSVSSPDYNNEAEECLHGEQLLAPAKDPQKALLAPNDPDPQNPPDDFKGAEECLHVHGEDTTLVTSPKETVEVKKKKRRWSWLRRLFTCKRK